MKIKKFKIICSSCQGTGYNCFEEDGFKYQSGCRDCGGDGDELYQKKYFQAGQGFTIQKLEILEEDCEHCSGSGKIIIESFKHGKGLFGEYRKVKRHKQQCEHCLGVGKQLAAHVDAQCPDCEGSGKIAYWGKGLFRKEYKKYKTCDKCLGTGEIDKRVPYTALA